MTVKPRIDLSFIQQRGKVGSDTRCGKINHSQSARLTHLSLIRKHQIKIRGSTCRWKIECAFTYCR
jgi:hypothetical protein